MAGYSGTPLVGKLGIKEHHRVTILGEPAGFAATLGPLPEYVEVHRELRRSSDVIIFFTDRAADLKRRLPGLKAKLHAGGGLWIAWPKRASKVPTDVTEDVIRQLALDVGLVDVKVCAIDEVWSGLRLCIPVADRRGGRRG